MSAESPQIGTWPKARRDIIDLAIYISEQSAEAASRFLDASEQTSIFLLKNPQAGALYPTENKRLEGLRVFQIHGFPNHLMFYRERSLGIEIIRVLHGSRNLDSISRLE